ncbi:MAG TPA: phosphatase PAP2 family protein [Pyrinomonadaceae bacterium]|jgi:PAP2 superfamily protein|nr:phosphatase PAP2 family protein [Pyrinomonadaceae bacterium]
MRSNRRSLCLFSMTVLIALIVTIAARAQTALPNPSPTPSSRSLEHEFFKNILLDQKAIWTSPFHLDQRDARWLAPIGLGTAALIATDRQTGDELAESSGQLQISRLVSYAGSIYGVAAVTGAFYIVGRTNHDDRARETGILGAEALVDSGVVVTVVKEITQRRRPTATKGRSDFWDGGSSFPSGHSIQAWSLATVIANEYHDHRAVQIAAYGIASAVSISRFTGEKHYLSDILVGSAMGYGIGRYVYRAHHRVSSSGGGEEEEGRLIERSGRWPAVTPVFDTHAHRYGLGLDWSF